MGAHGAGAPAVGAERWQAVNERNVGALAELLLATGTVCDGDPMRTAEARAAAEALAARGVLVPSALTEEQAHWLTDGFEDGEWWEGAMAIPWQTRRDLAIGSELEQRELRWRLEHIAKGEGA